MEQVRKIILNHDGHFTNYEKRKWDVFYIKSLMERAEDTGDPELILRSKNFLKDCYKEKHNNSYVYPKTVRTDIDGKRHYDIDGGKWKLPSVTQYYRYTVSREARIVANWPQREGEDNAARIVARSGARGTAMHKILEKYILEQGYLDQTEVGQKGSQYGSTIYKKRIM
ncbi:MAG: hypothetical protein CM15mV103_400 [uncultured marine virus]|nr:MAG: hypothetical protein CM15mV103_400 [uncultured marine virus]